MTGTQHAWVWAALEGLVDHTAQHDEAVNEVERLAGCVTHEMDRIQAATGLSRQRLDEMVEGMRVIGSPLDGAVPAGGLAPCSPADAENPLSIPAFLRRGQDTLKHDADAVARSSAP